MIHYTAHAVNTRTYVQRERARRAARTSAAIETAVLREVARHGYHALRMTDVALRAHVAPRTLYLHATSKERLVEQALRRRAAAQIARVDRTGATACSASRGRGAQERGALGAWGREYALDHVNRRGCDPSDEATQSCGSHCVVACGPVCGARDPRVPVRVRGSRYHTRR